MSRWDSFRGFWNLSDEESPITDASSAEDSLVEDLILRFQEVTKETTDKLVQLSAARSGSDERLHKLNESVILAYAAALDGNLDKVKKILEKVVNV